MVRVDCRYHTQPTSTYAFLLERLKSSRQSPSLSKECSTVTQSKLACSTWTGRLSLSWRVVKSDANELPETDGSLFNNSPCITSLSQNSWREWALSLSCCFSATAKHREELFSLQLLWQIVPSSVKLKLCAEASLDRHFVTCSIEHTLNYIQMGN